MRETRKGKSERQKGQISKNEKRQREKVLKVPLVNNFRAKVVEFSGSSNKQKLWKRKGAIKLLYIQLL